MASFKQFIRSIQSKGNDGKSFALFVEWFLKNDPEWSSRVDKVWHWREWPERWGPDCGIDLIFRCTRGKIWAVQAKCYDEKYYVTKKDVDTFLSESSRTIIYKRLLITTTDLLSRNAERTCKGQEKPVVRYMLKDFEEAALIYPSSFAKLHSINWDEGFSHLQAYIQQHKHSLVPQKYETPDDYPLGHWVGTQRSSKRKNSKNITPERIAKLESLDEWVWGPASDRWEEGFENLLDYIGRVGNSRVPNKYKTHGGYPLGWWVGSQRGNREKLSLERVARLDALSNWVWDALFD